MNESLADILADVAKEKERRKRREIFFEGYITALGKKKRNLGTKKGQKRFIKMLKAFEKWDEIHYPD